MDEIALPWECLEDVLSNDTNPDYKELARAWQAQGVRFVEAPT